MAEKIVIILLQCCIELFLVQTLPIDYTCQNNVDFSEGVSVQSTDPNKEAWLRQKYSVFCGKDAIKVVLPPGPLSEVKVLGKCFLILCWVFFSCLYKICT